MTILKARRRVFLVGKSERIIITNADRRQLVLDGKRREVKK